MYTVTQEVMDVLDKHLAFSDGEELARVRAAVEEAAPLMIAAYLDSIAPGFSPEKQAVLWVARERALRG